MKNFVITCCFFFIVSNAQAKITIFACEPEWAALARQIVKNEATIQVATTSDQNPRNVEVKSTLVAASRSAAMIFCSGGDLEQSWLPTMINKGYNLKALTNDNSLLLAINYIENPRSFNKDEVVRVGRKEYLRNGSRVHLNPHNIDKIAAEFTRRVKLLDPIHANFYEKSYRDFAIKWQEAIKKWEERAFTLRGMPLIANDNSWNYLADWLGLEITTIIDSETMAKANPTSLQVLVKKLKTNPVEAIIFARWEDKRNLLWLRDTAKVRVVSLPYSVGGSANNSDLFKLFDSIINGLLTDCSSGVCRSLAPPKTSTVKLR
jgi:zinc/manganese transport system substrate-binding protein